MPGVSGGSSPFGEGRRPLLDRPRLVTRIGDPTTAMTELTIVRTPTGYGKTTLLRQWLTWFGHAADVIALGLPPVADNLAPGQPPPRFSGLLPYLESILTGAEPVPDLALPVLVGPLAQDGPPLVIVVDQIEHFRAEAITWLVEHLADGTDSGKSPIRLVLSGRTAVELPPAAAAQGRVTHLSPADLVFTLQEMEYLLGDVQVAGPARLDDLIVETKGWPAGVRMYQAFSSDAPGSGLTSLIDTYVESEILDRLEPANRKLLTSCLALPYVTTELAGLLYPNNSDPSEALSQLGQVLPVVWHRRPDRQPAYRILPMIKASLQRIARHSGSTSIDSAVVARAASWYIARNQLPEAIHLARSTGEWHLVLQQLLEPCRELALRDRHADLLDILESVPVEQIHHCPDLAFWRVLSFLSTGRDGEAFRDWNSLAPLQPAQWDPLTEGRALLLQSMLERARENRLVALDLAKQAHNLLPPTAHHERFRTLSVMLDLDPVIAESDRLRRIESDLRFERSMLPSDQRWWWTHSVPAHIDRRALTGSLETARDLCLHHLRTMPQYPEADRMSLLARLAEIDRERGDPEQALGHVAGVSDGLVRWREGVNIDLVRAQVLHDLGQESAARDIVYACIRTSSKSGDTSSERKARTVLAQFWLDRGQIDLAQTWAAEDQPLHPDWVTSLGDAHPTLVHAELLIATQQADHALILLAPFALEGRQRGHHAPLVRCYALMALAQWSLGNLEGTREAIAEAVQLGSRHGFRRSFVIGSMDVRSLSSRPVPVGAVVASVASSAPETESPLTDRELEVLQLVESGLRNPDISDRLFISPFTVKNHLANIFTKLNARNRTDAVRIAQSMGWL